MSTAREIQGILQTWRVDGIISVVPMGSAEFVDFSQKPAIGTENLNSCSVVLVVSPYGAILAHITPRPTDPPPPQAGAQSNSELYSNAGDENVRTMMGQVKYLYNLHRSHFPTSSTHVVCAVFKGAVALPHQKAIMQDIFREMGLDPVTHFYNVPVNTGTRGYGTVVAAWYPGEASASVWVEDQIVAGNDPRQQTQATLGQDPGPSMSSGQAAAASAWPAGGNAPAAWTYEQQTWTYEQQMSTTGGPSVTAQGSGPGQNQYGQTQTPQVGGSRQTDRTWKEVQFRIEPHVTRRDEYIFRDKKGHNQSTDRSDWHRDMFDGKSVWVFKRGSTHYYTYQKIKQ